MNNKSLLWIINYLTKKDDIYLPETISNYFIDSSNNITDISFYFHYVTSDVFKKESPDMIKLYIKAKKIKNSFNKFFYLFKVKKSNRVTEQDLYLNDLSNFPDKQKVSILIDNSIYDFRIANIINLWKDCLTKNDGLFVKPIELKNPFTNLPFKKYNLYNIFFSIYHSDFIMNSLILSFFKVDFDLTLFIYINFPLLKEISIQNFIKFGHSSELYDEINNMLVEYEKDIGYYYLPQSITSRRKKFYITELSSSGILHYYLIHKFSCNPLKKKQGYDRCKFLLKEYFEKSSNTAFYIRGININNYINPTNIPIPQILISQDEIEPEHPDPPSISPPPPPTNQEISNNDIEFEMEINEEHDELEVQSISSEDSELANVSFDNPFESSFNLPRTPPNFNYSRSSQQSPFQMNMFRRS